MYCYTTLCCAILYCYLLLIPHCRIDLLLPFLFYMPPTKYHTLLLWTIMTYYFWFIVLYVCIPPAFVVLSFCYIIPTFTTLFIAILHCIIHFLLLFTTLLPVLLHCYSLYALVVYTFCISLGWFVRYRLWCCAIAVVIRFYDLNRLITLLLQLWATNSGRFWTLFFYLMIDSSCSDFIWFVVGVCWCVRLIIDSRYSIVIQWWLLCGIGIHYYYIIPLKILPTIHSIILPIYWFYILLQYYLYCYAINYDIIYYSYYSLFSDCYYCYSHVMTMRRHTIPLPLCYSTHFIIYWYCCYWWYFIERYSLFVVMPFYC